MDFQGCVKDWLAVQGSEPQQHPNLSSQMAPWYTAISHTAINYTGIMSDEEIKELDFILSPFNQADSIEGRLGYMNNEDTCQEINHREVDPQAMRHILTTMSDGQEDSFTGSQRVCTNTVCETSHSLGKETVSHGSSRADSFHADCDSTTFEQVTKGHQKSRRACNTCRKAKTACRSVHGELFSNASSIECSRKAGLGCMRCTRMEKECTWDLKYKVPSSDK